MSRASRARSISLLSAGHAARLNFGDCRSYALAVDAREPLLWKRDDFAYSGSRSALDDPIRQRPRSTDIACGINLGKAHILRLWC